MDSGESARKSLKVLRSRSKEALGLATKVILEERLGKEADAAIRDYLKKWGDTTHPGVLSLACEAVGGDLAKLIPIQVAMLLIAATMDIHDDIIDNSVAKATGKTIYGKTGTERALLLGNAFLVKGFAQLSRAIEQLSLKRRALIIDTAEDFLLEVSKAHIVEVELRARKFEVDPKKYFRVLQRKGADIEGQMRIGAIFGGGTNDEIEALGKYGRCLGVLLAVRSDFVDVFEPKELENRVRNECLPLPVLYALRDGKYEKRILKALSNGIDSKNEFQEFLRIIYEAPNCLRLRQRLSNLSREAVETLRVIRCNKAKSNLEDLAKSILEDL